MPEQTWQNSHWIACTKFMKEAKHIIFVVSLQDSCIHTLSVQNVNAEEVGYCISRPSVLLAKCLVQMCPRHCKQRTRILNFLYIKVCVLSDNTD